MIPPRCSTCAKCGLRSPSAQDARAFEQAVSEVTAATRARPPIAAGARSPSHPRRREGAGPGPLEAAGGPHARSFSVNVQPLPPSTDDGSLGREPFQPRHERPQQAKIQRERHHPDRSGSGAASRSRSGARRCGVNAKSAQGPATAPTVRVRAGRRGIDVEEPGQDDRLRGDVRRTRDDRDRRWIDGGESRARDDRPGAFRLDRQRGCVDAARDFAEWSARRSGCRRSRCADLRISKGSGLAPR